VSFSGKELEAWLKLHETSAAAVEKAAAEQRNAASQALAREREILRQCRKLIQARLGRLPSVKLVLTIKCEIETIKCDNWR